jgi:aspartyl-tRNA(Asn)/glutamyl-tRNA(Gln) amidotransferase subunit C
MSLSLEEVEHIASLARLELSPEQKNRYRQQLSAILDYIAKLQELDTADIPPMTAGLPAQGHLRLDEPRLGLEHASLLANASEVEEGQFKIPPVFELPDK